MQEIVIHEGKGGFGVSEEAVYWLRERDVEAALDVDLTQNNIPGAHRYEIDIERDNPTLVECVRELGGDEATGNCAALRVVKLKQRGRILNREIEWEILEGGSGEIVVEKGHYWP
jgi:hypothetical protein